MDYLSRNLTPTECYQLYNLLHSHRRSQGRYGTTKHHAIPCASLLNTWISDPDETRYKLYKKIFRKLKQIGRIDLAYWIAQNAANHNRLTFSEMLKPDHVEDYDGSIRKISSNKISTMSGKDGNETHVTNSAQCFSFDCWRFVCIIIVIAIMMFLLLYCCRYFHRGIFPIYRRKWLNKSRDEKCFIKSDKYDGIEKCSTRQNTYFRNNLHCMPKLSNTFTNECRSNSHGSYLENDRDRERTKLITPRKRNHTDYLKGRKGNIDNSPNLENYTEPCLTLSNWNFLPKVTKNLKASVCRLKRPTSAKSVPTVLNNIRLNKEEEEIVQRCVNNQEKADISFSDTDIHLLMKSAPLMNTYNEQQGVNRKKERFEIKKMLPYFNNDKNQQRSIHDFQLDTIDCCAENLEKCSRIFCASSDSEKNYAISLTLIPTMSADHTKFSSDYNINLRLHVTELNEKSILSNLHRSDKRNVENDKSLVLNDARKRAKSYITLPNTKLRGIRKVKSADQCSIYGIYNFNKVLRHSLSSMEMEISGFQVHSDLLQDDDKYNSKHQDNEQTQSKKMQLTPKENTKMFNSITQIRESSHSDSEVRFHIPPETGILKNNQNDLKMQQNSSLLSQERENNKDMPNYLTESLEGSEISESYDELGMLISQYLKEQIKPCQRNYCSLRRRLRHRVWHDQRKCRMRSKYNHKHSYDQRPSCSSGNICKDTYDELKLMHASPIERGFLYKSIYERRKQFLSQPCVSLYTLPLDS